MNNIDALIEKAKMTGPEGTSARRELMRLGAKAAPAVIEELRRSPLDRIRLFSELLEGIRDPAVVPILLKLLNDENPSVKLVAHKALGKLKDERAFQPLSDQLSDSNNLEYTRTLAARALGELGVLKARVVLLGAADRLIGQPRNTNTHEEIRRWVISETSEDRLRLAIEIAVAVAKLGDHTLWPMISAIITDRDLDKDASEGMTVGSEAVRALNYIVGPHMLHTLEVALGSTDPEVRGAAIDPLRYLGLSEAVSVLIPAAKDEYESVGAEALAAIYDITAEWPNGEQSIEELEIGALQDWWVRRKSNFKPGICYRLGQPMWLLSIVELLDNTKQRGRTLRELEVITGQDFSNSKAKEVRDWYGQNGERFEVGHLYKYGHKQDIPQIS